MVNNPFQIILGSLVVLLMRSTSLEEIDLAVKGLSVIFNKINEYALNIESLSDFADLDLK